jgi:hypothetical protein
MKIKKMKNSKKSWKEKENNAENDKILDHESITGSPVTTV